jgi:hypothetical protein
MRRPHTVAVHAKHDIPELTHDCAEYADRAALTSVFRVSRERKGDDAQSTQPVRRMTGASCSRTQSAPQRKSGQCRAATCRRALAVLRSPGVQRMCRRTSLSGTAPALRGGAAFAAFVMLAGCAATEGPLLRAVGEPAGDGSIAGSSGSTAASGGSAGATAGTGGSIAGSGGTGGSTAGSGGMAGDPRIVRGMSFQYQLVDEVNIDVDAELFVVDLFNADVEIIDALHAQDKVVVAYVSAGTHEPYRDDADSFPASTVGQPLESYPDES